MVGALLMGIVGGVVAVVVSVVAWVMFHLGFGWLFTLLALVGVLGLAWLIPKAWDALDG